MIVALVATFIILQSSRDEKDYDSSSHDVVKGICYFLPVSLNIVPIGIAWCVGHCGKNWQSLSIKRYDGMTDPMNSFSYLNVKMK